MRRHFLRQVGIALLLGCITSGAMAASGWVPTKAVMASDTTDDPAQPQNPQVPFVREVKGSGGKLMEVTFPGQSPMQVPSAKLGEVLASYTEGLVSQLFPNYGPALIQRGWSGVKDEITEEVEQILGELENDLMNGIKDEIEQLAQQALGSLLNISPISEVARLRKMVKDGMSKHQKIEYQNYKVDYAWKKAHTELSENFVSYYEKKELKKKFQMVSMQEEGGQKLLNSGVFTPAEQQQYGKILSTLSFTDDLAAEVKTACNLSQTAVWMSEGERINVLDMVEEDLFTRVKSLKAYNAEIAKAATARRKQLMQNRLTKSLYREGTKLNRNVSTYKTIWE
ncbi:hypothetical protein [Nibrella saemangeumensis]